jgi:hypothetical protein
MPTNPSKRLQRRMSPPRGRLLEAKRGTTRRAQAELALLVALNRTLPASAFDELREGSETFEPENWANRWKVNAPCVVVQAKDLAAYEQMRRTAGDQPTSAKLGKLGESYVGAEPAAIWPAELLTLNQKSVEFDRLEAISDIVAAEDDPHVDAKARQIIRQAREELLEHGGRKRGPGGPRPINYRFLAPIATDPLRESRNHFIERARDHWDARAALAQRRFGAALVAPTPRLRKHAEWAVRHLVGGEKISTIARTNRVNGVSRPIAPQTVSEAITRFRQLVDWQLQTR